MPLSMEVGLDAGHIVLYGIKLPLKGAQPPFSAHVCCGQMAGGIKMSLDAEVGLGPDDIVLDGDPAPPTERGTATFPHFSAHVYCVQTVTHLSNC